MEATHAPSVGEKATALKDRGIDRLLDRVKGNLFARSVLQNDWSQMGRAQSQSDLNISSRGVTARSKRPTLRGRV